MTRENPIPWELCATMNNHWGYCNFDHQYKTPQMLVRKLVECASKGGNMILNVGPDARGNIPEESVQILTEVGKWMKKNGESIYGCGISKLEKPDWGRYPRKVTSFMLMFMRHRLEHFRCMESARISWNLLHILQTAVR